MHHSSCLEELDGPNCGDGAPQESIWAHLIPNYSLQLFDRKSVGGVPCMS